MPIIIKDRLGREHVFPDGFDPQRAAQIVKSQMEQEPKAPAPAATSASPSNGGLPEEHTTLEGVFGVLNTVPRLLAQTATSGIQVAKGKESLGQAARDVVGELNPYSKTTGETPLEELGMQEGWLRTGLGLALDLASPIGPVGTIAGAVGKGALAGTKLIAKEAGLAKAAEVLKPAASMIESKFVQYPGMSKLVGKTSGTAAEDYLRLHEASLDAAAGDARSKLAKIFANVNDADAPLIADHLNNPVKYPLPQGRADLEQVVSDIKSLTKEQFATELNAGQQQLLKHNADGSLKMQPLAKVPTGPAGPPITEVPVKTEIENYFPWVRKVDRDGKLVYEVKAVGSKNPFNKERTVKTWEQFKELPGAVTDPMQALEKRLAVGQRAVKNQDFFAVMAQEFGTAAKGPLPKGYRELNLNKINLADQSKATMLKGVAFPEQLANILEKNQLIFADPEGTRKILKTINRGFKTVVTTLNPAHHANNLQGNINLMSLGGMKVRDIIKAYAPKSLDELTTLIGHIKPKEGVSPQQVTDSINKFRAQPLGGKITLGEAFDKAKEYNLFGSAEVNIDVAQALGRNKNKVTKGIDKLRLTTSRYIEDPAKWALFKDQILKGKTPEQAAIHVKNFLFDYNELTDFEKGLRDYGAAPFYSWLRKNLPLQAKSVVQRPERFRRLQVAYDAPDRFSGGDLLGQPLWQKEEGYEPIMTNEDGSKTVVRMANPALDLNKLTSPGAFLKSLAGPIPTAVVEGVTGRDLRTGQQILGTKTGYTAASPIGSTMEQLRLAGVPLGTSFGTEATPEGKLIQPELVAFALNQIPTPLLPYAQRIAGSPGETIGTSLKTGWGRRLGDILLRGAGLTPRNLTSEQQIAVIKQLLDEMKKKEIEQLKIKTVGEALRNQ